MKKIVILLMFLVLASSLYAGEIWVQAYDAGNAIMFDLSQTIEKPSTSAWQDSYKNNLIGIVGQYQIGSDKYLKISNISISTPIHNGYFTLQSSAHLGVGLRHFRLGYSVSTDSSSAPMHEILADEIGSLEITLAGSSSSSHMNFFLWLPDAQYESDLIVANDYNAVLSMTVESYKNGTTTNPVESTVLYIPLYGYYGTTQPSVSNVFLNVYNYGLVFNLRQDDLTTPIKIGTIDFHSSSTYATKAPTTKYVIGIGPDANSFNSTDTSKFLMKKFSTSGSSSTTNDDTNSVPLKITVVDTTMNKTNAGNWTAGGNLDSGSASTRYLYAYLIKQSRVATKSSSMYGYIYDYSGDVYMQLDTSNYSVDKLTNTLLSGSYSCNIYFFVSTN